MMVKTLQFAAILCTAVAMAAGWAHLLELPNKMGLSADDYLTVQRIHRGWSLIGIAVVAALVATAWLTILQRNEGITFYFCLAATLCIAISLVVFFLLTLPVNRMTHDWTILPQNWEALRRQWEYSHAVAAILYFVAMALLVLSVVLGRH